jgi:protein SCO1/2
MDKLHISRLTGQAARLQVMSAAKKYVALFLIAALALAPCIMGGSAEAAERKYQRTVETYTIPDVVLINQDGKKVRLRKLLLSEKPVIVDFIFGTCTTICPVLSAGFSNLQHKLGPESGKVSLVSISIDPENDTPKVMKDYLKRFRAKPGWDFLSGSRKDIDSVMKAFDAYIPNKMSHFAVNFIKAPDADTWVRINGLMSSADFMSEGEKAGITWKK